MEAIEYLANMLWIDFHSGQHDQYLSSPVSSNTPSSDVSTTTQTGVTSLAVKYRSHHIDVSIEYNCPAEVRQINTFTLDILNRN